MAETTFPVCAVENSYRRFEKVDYIAELRTTMKCPIEGAWYPRGMLINCNGDNALVSAMSMSFNYHLPLTLSPDVIWITLLYGLSQHINLNAEKFRRLLVSHNGVKELEVERLDFEQGKENPWAEVFEEFHQKLVEMNGNLSGVIDVSFSTTGPVEHAVSHLMTMEMRKTYYVYTLKTLCGTPSITLTGTLEDWTLLRRKVKEFCAFQLDTWVSALDPILAQFENAMNGDVNVEFWKSMFHLQSHSGSPIMNGWANVLFPFVKGYNQKLFPNAQLDAWNQALKNKQLNWTDLSAFPKGATTESIPACLTSIPLKIDWNNPPLKLRLVGGLMGVTQNHETCAVQPEAGWAVVHDIPTDPPPRERRICEDGKIVIKYF